jgi:hypothetical protein
LAVRTTDPAGSSHNKILECANRGDTTLGRLTEAGYAAVTQLTASGKPHSTVRKNETTD